MLHEDNYRRETVLSALDLISLSLERAIIPYDSSRLLFNTLYRLVFLKHLLFIVLKPSTVNIVNIVPLR